MYMEIHANGFYHSLSVDIYTLQRKEKLRLKTCYIDFGCPCPVLGVPLKT